MNHEQIELVRKLGDMCDLEVRNAICDLALDGLRLRQGKVVFSATTPTHLIGWDALLRGLSPGQQIVLVDREAKL